MMLVEGQGVRLVLHRKLVVTSTAGVVIRPSKARVQESQSCQHLPPDRCGVWSYWKKFPLRSCLVLHWILMIRVKHNI